MELIELEAVHTQEEIANKLKEAGFIVTQATISRDIKSLGLFKFTQGESTRYTNNTSMHQLNSKANEVLSGVIYKIFDKGGNLFLEVENGCGKLVKQGLKKLIDNGIAMLSDDDTIVVYFHDEEQAKITANKLREYF